jgi:hypothetical protein
VERKLILRGLLAGGIAGLAAFVCARVFAEPLIRRAIAYEEGRAHAEAALGGGGHTAHDAEVVSRAVQENAGLGLGMIAFGVVLGGLYAVAYALCLGRTGRVRPRQLALLVALAGFVVLYLVPFLKYPATPPAVGSDETVRERTGLYLLLLGVALVAAVVAVAVGQALRPRLGSWNASVVAGLGFVVVVGAAMALLPAHGGSPLPLRDAEGNIAFPGFPADVLADFRVYALAAQAVLWSVLGVTFAPLAAKLLPAAQSDLTTGQVPAPTYVSA